MVRTKADSGACSRKVVAASAPRKSLAGPSSSASSPDGSSPAGKGKYAGGNPVVVRPKPDWQKGISAFFAKGASSSSSTDSSSSSSSSSSSQDGPSGSGSSSSSMDVDE